MKRLSTLIILILLMILLALSATAIGAQTELSTAQGANAYPGPDPAEVYVDQSFIGTELGTLDAPFRTITAGVNAVAADGIVRVAPGVYVENLVIDKSLTLHGSGLDVTTIDGGGKGNTIALSTSGLSVIVEHFKITGAGSNPQVSDTGLKGKTGSSFIARWNWFTGNGLNAVISYGPDVIEHNLFSNNGGNQIANYVVWASSNSTAQIYNNTIRQSSLGDVGSNHAWVAIALYNDAVAADIRNNIIADADYGIRLLQTSGSPQSTIDYNILWNNGTNYDGGIAPGTHDQAVDPKLTTTSYLNTGSPAVDAGDPAAAFNDRDGTRNDVGMRQLYITAPVNPGRYGNFATLTTRQPLGLAATGASVWMSSYWYDPGLYRLDVANGDPRQTVVISGTADSRYGGLAFDNVNQILYHSTIYGEGIQMIDPGSGRVMATLPFTVKSGGDLAYDGTNLWQAAGGWPDPKLYKIDANNGAILDAFVSPVPGQTQTFGMAYTNGALWMSKGNRIYKINPTTQSIICSFVGPMADMRGLAFLPGYDMLASSFSLDRVMRFDLPPACDENTQPANPITANWSPVSAQTFKTQVAYSNEGICNPRVNWQNTTVTPGDVLPKTTGGTIRGLRMLLPNDTILVDGTGLSGARLTSCGGGLWTIWSASPAGWTQSLGVASFNWNPPRTPGITLVWDGEENETQTLRFQHRVANEDICTPRSEDWSSLPMQSGDYLPVVSDPNSQVANFSGVRLNLADGDSLQSLELDDNTQLRDCGNNLWVIWSTSPADFAKAYGSVQATWAKLPQGEININFLGIDPQNPRQIQWQPILEGQAACAIQPKWTETELGPGSKVPVGNGMGVRLRLDRDSLLTSLRLKNTFVRDCGGGNYAILANNTIEWGSVIGTIAIDWSALYQNLDCVWFQNTETVDHNRERSSHLWCRDDGTVTAFYEAGGSTTRTVTDGHASIPAGVNRVRPGGLFATDLTATLHDPMDITIHFVPVNLVDVGIAAPSGVEYIPLLLETLNLPYFSYSYEWESTINVSGNTANEIWTNMETAMNGQPAVVGSHAYMLIASSADSPTNYELWFGQGPFNTWKGMFFLEHPTTYIHELLHSLLGLKHVGGAPGPDPDWPYGATRTFPEEATFWGNTKVGTWERLHFTGNDCDALMSYGNSNPYGMGTDYRVRCLSPFTGDKGWDEVVALSSQRAATSVLANSPVMWTKGPDLFQFDLAHTSLGDTSTGPVMTLNPGQKDEQSIIVPAYEADPGYIIDAFVGLPDGVNTAEFEGRQYPPNFGTLAESSWVKTDLTRSLAVTTECAWLLSEPQAGLDRLVGGPYVGSQTVTLSDQIEVKIQFSCADGERTEGMTFPLPPVLYLPLVSGN